MKLIVPVPAEWKQQDVVDGVVLHAPNEGFGILVMPLGPAADDPEVWIQRAMVHRTRQKGVEPRNLRLSRFSTADGWGAILLEGDVGTEARLVAYFAFLDYAATVIAICRDPQKHAGWRADALAILAQARPDFTQEGAITLGQLLGAPPQATVVHGRAAVGWRRTFSGGDLVLTGEDGASVGWIRISRQLAPVRPVDQLFRPFLGAPAEGDTVEPPQVLATAEGEHAVLASVSSATRQHTLGVVYGDDYFASVEGMCSDPEQYRRYRTTVHQLTYGTTLGLARERWRRFYYEVPPGWTGVARARGTVWVGPQMPGKYQVLRIFDARPESEHAAQHGARMFETLPSEFFTEPPKGPVTFYTADEVPCRVSVFTGRVPNRPGVLKALEGTLLKEPFVYPLRIECDEELVEDAMHVFEQIVSTIRMLPERTQPHELDLGGMTMWAD